MYHFADADLPWKEREKIRHEINTCYSKYWGLPIIAHRSLGIDDRYYIYYVENHGFDEYCIFLRVDDMDEEEITDG